MEVQYARITQYRKCTNALVHYTGSAQYRNHTKPEVHQASMYVNVYHHEDDDDITSMHTALSSAPAL